MKPGKFIEYYLIGNRFQFIQSINLSITHEVFEEVNNQLKVKRLLDIDSPWRFYLDKFHSLAELIKLNCKDTFKRGEEIMNKDCQDIFNCVCGSQDISLVCKVDLYHFSCNECTHKSFPEYSVEDAVQVWNEKMSDPQIFLSVFKQDLEKLSYLQKVVIEAALIDTMEDPEKQAPEEDSMVLRGAGRDVIELLQTMIDRWDFCKGLNLLYTDPKHYPIEGFENVKSGFKRPLLLVSVSGWCPNCDGADQLPESEHEGGQFVYFDDKYVHVIHECEINPEDHDYEIQGTWEDLEDDLGSFSIFKEDMIKLAQKIYGDA